MATSYRKLSLLACVGLGLGAGSAFAQASDPTTSQTAAADEAATLETVVVTAEKRSVDVQKTAVAISVLGGEDLRSQGKATVEDSLMLIPGVNIKRGSNAGNTIFTIRGTQAAQNTDPTVNVNVDGVYQSNTGAPQFDVARIEVLKGPQGTLYGRNATAGVVNIVTADPVFRREGFASLQFGNYSAYKAEGAINASIGETLALRLSGLYNQRDGFLSNGANDLDVAAIRGKALWTPTPALSLLAAVEFDRTRGVGAGAVPTGAALVPLDQREHPWFTPDPAGGSAADRVSVYAVFKWDVGFGVLTYQPAYYALKQLSDAELTGPTQGLALGATRNTQRTHEVRLSAPEDSRIKWQIGYFNLDYLNTSINHDPLVNVPVRSAATGGLFQPSLTSAQATAEPGIPYRRPTSAAGLLRPIAHDKAWAVFGQATYPVTDALRVTAGARYSEDSKTRQNRIFNAYGVESSPYAAISPTVLSSAGLTPCTSPLTRSDCYQSHDYTSFTYKVGVEYDLTPTSMLYADVAKGYKAGGLNILPVPAGTSDSFAPEDVLAYEIGSKNRFLDNRLQVNVDAYYYDYTNKQLIVVGAPIAPNPLPSTPTLNAGKATLYGFEGAVQWLATPNDRLSLSVAYNHTNVDEAPPITFAYLLDQPLPNAPEWTETLGYEHTFDLGSAGSIVVGGDTRFYSSYHVDINYARPDSVQPSYHLTDLHITYTAPSRFWSLTGYVNNLEDEVVRATAFSDSRMIVEAPRTYGVNLGLKF